MRLFRSVVGLPAKLDAFKQDCDAHPATDAKCSQPASYLSSFHFVQQRGGNPRAGATYRMAEGNRAAVDVQTIVIKLQFAIAGDDLRGEGLVQFNQIDVRERQLLPFEQSPGRRYRADPHDFRSDTRNFVINQS